MCLLVENRISIKAGDVDNYFNRIYLILPFFTSLVAGQMDEGGHGINTRMVIQVIYSSWSFGP